jgi:Na+-transporting NADH:ubiquinone oxidoreductase subunit A
MKTVSIKKTYKMRIAGSPYPEIVKGPALRTVAVLPERFLFIKPRLLVKKGDHVKIGEPLFEDKENSKMRFLSPGAGAITDIHYGPRRVISRIVIELDRQEEHIPFDPLGEKTLSGLNRDQLTDQLLARGLWPLIRNLTYRVIASPDERPNSLWVWMDPSDPFQVPSSIYLKDNENLFVSGIKSLERLGIPVFVCERESAPITDPKIAPLITHRAAGAYPAEDPGVVLYHTKQSAAENHAWYIKGQDVLMLAEGLTSGRYPTSRIVAVSGISNGGKKPDNRYVETRLGAPLESLVVNLENTRGQRWITGGLFRGRTTAPDDYMGFYHTSLTLIEEAMDPELFGFLRPGLNKPTASRTFLYALRKKELPARADMRGEERACINCGKCAAICPVDILVQFAYKCLYAGEIEEGLSHGLLDCVECGLCSYVCPAKIELAESLKFNKHAYYKQRI